MHKLSSLFRVVLQHQFYTGQTAEGLTLQPTAATQAVMVQHDLLWRKDGTGYQMLYGQQSPQVPLLLKGSETLVLRFVLRSDNPYFLHITDMPLPSKGAEKFYFHNQRTQTVENQTISLAGASEASAADLKANELGLRPTDLGVVDFFVGGGENALRPPLDNQPVQEQAYRLVFKARPTRWRYFVIQKDHAPPTDLQLFDGKMPLAAEIEPTQDFPQLKQQAAVISTKAPFPLAEHSALKPKLSLRLSDQPDHSLTVDLPTPDGQHLTAPTDPAALQMFSDMFVYL